VVPGGDQQQRRGVGADAVQREQAGGMGGDERDDELIEAAELVIEELGAAAQFPQCDAGGIANDIAGPGPQRGQLGDECRRRMAGEPGSPRRCRPGPWGLRRPGRTARPAPR
jgi:hypothetical protein